MKSRLPVPEQVEDDPATRLALEHYLHRHVPLSHAMQVSVIGLSGESVLLGAPLAPNLNPHATVFGGSACALAILSAWTLLHVRLRSRFPGVGIVIQRQSMIYRRPIEGAFSARSSLVRPLEWPQFVRLLSRRGRARIAVAAMLAGGGVEHAAQFTGEYVALRGG